MPVPRIIAAICNFPKEMIELAKKNFPGTVEQNKIVDNRTNDQFHASYFQENSENRWTNVGNATTTSSVKGYLCDVLSKTPFDPENQGNKKQYLYSGNLHYTVNDPQKLIAQGKLNPNHPLARLAQEQMDKNPEVYKNLIEIVDNTKQRQEFRQIDINSSENKSTSHNNDDC